MSYTVINIAYRNIISAASRNGNCNRRRSSATLRTIIIVKNYVAPATVSINTAAYSTVATSGRSARSTGIGPVIPQRQLPVLPGRAMAETISSALSKGEIGISTRTNQVVGCGSARRSCILCRITLPAPGTPGYLCICLVC